MTTKVTPFGVDLTYGDDKGADNWHIWTDLNYTKLSALSQIDIEGFVASLPAVDDGKRYILTTTDELVADYEGTHNYFTAFAGLRVLDKSDSSHWFFDGTAWLDEDDYGDLPAIIACVYALNATALELAGFGIPAKLTASLSDQKGTHILLGGAVSVTKGMSVSGGPLTGSPVPLDSGQRAIRFIVTVPTLVDGGAYINQGVIEGAILYSTAPAIISQLVLEARKNGECQLRLILAAGTVLTLDNLTPGDIVCDLLYDSVAGTVALWKDNVPQVLSSDVYLPATAFPVLQITEVANAVGNAGLISAIQMVTDAASITGTTFPVGTTTICGDLI